MTTWHLPLGTARKVQASEKAASTAADLGVIAERAEGRCPACGYFNLPDSDAQIGQDANTVYCMACGHVWRRRLMEDAS